jgi:hypothetical protein
LHFPVLFSYEIPVGSFLIAKVSENTELKTLVFLFVATLLSLLLVKIQLKRIYSGLK